MTILTVPEAKKRVATATEPFITVAARVIERIRQGGRPLTDDQSITIVANLIREADNYADIIAAASTEIQAKYQDETIMVSALRRTGYLIMVDINPDQAWFWTEEWQAKERESDADEAAGRMTFHATTDDFLAALEARMHSADA
ncbi:MAG TPA: hypothetical protein VN837_19070 [Chloroflexota bacterium]|nr:hypothetical protein [Chloroflexota bacterium]